MNDIQTQCDPMHKTKCDVASTLMIYFEEAQDRASMFEKWFRGRAEDLERGRGINKQRKMDRLFLNVGELLITDRIRYANLILNDPEATVLSREFAAGILSGNMLDDAAYISHKFYLKHRPYMRHFVMLVVNSCLQYADANGIKQKPKKLSTKAPKYVAA